MKLLLKTSVFKIGFEMLSHHSSFVVVKKNKLGAKG